MQFSGNLGSTLYPLRHQEYELQYVKTLQQVVNDYYEKCPMEVMRRLELQTSDILNVMYDSVTNHNFDRVSDDMDSFRCG